MDTSAGKTQTWKQNAGVVEHMREAAANQAPLHPVKGQANFYPAGELMFNGGQGAGDGGRKVLFDTEEPNADAQGQLDSWEAAIALTIAGSQKDASS